MNRSTTIRRQVAYALAVGMIFVCRLAEACDGCRQSIGGDGTSNNGAGGGTAVNSEGVAYAVSITMMIFMVIAVISFLGVMMYRNCQKLAAAHRIALTEEDDGGLSVASRA